MNSKFMIGSIALIAAILVLSGFQKNKQNTPWTDKQLMEPAVLAEKLNTGKMENTYIFNIGPAGEIKNSIAIGATQEAGNLTAFKNRLTRIPKDAAVVIYCGCCPFEHCPNIRPAFELLNEMKFSNAKLLDLPKNLKVNWIDYGYPMQK